MNHLTGMVSNSHLDKLLRLKYTISFKKCFLKILLYSNILEWHIILLYLVIVIFKYILKRNLLDYLQWFHRNVQNIWSDRSWKEVLNSVDPDKKEEKDHYVEAEFLIFLSFYSLYFATWFSSMKPYTVLDFHS